jgi:putative DNA primase/helicase
MSAEELRVASLKVLQEMQAQMNARRTQESAPVQTDAQTTADKAAAIPVPPGTKVACQPLPKASPQTVDPVVPGAPLTFFESIALPLLSRGFKVAPCYPEQKTVHTRLVPDPLNQISNDPAKIHEWGMAEPNANVCVYAEQRPGGLCFLDKDAAISLVEKYERETGKRFPQTLLVCSSVNDDGKGGTFVKGHWYFYQSVRTIAMQNNISEKSTGGVLSFRVRNEYVTSIGSIHPKTKKPYTVANEVPIIVMPDDFLDWLLAQVIAEPKTRQEAAERGKFKTGTRYNALISELGHMWNRGYSRDMCITAGLAWASENFDIPEGCFNEGMVQKEIEHFLDHGYPQKPNQDLVMPAVVPLNTTPEKEEAKRKTKEASERLDSWLNDEQQLDDDTIVSLCGLLTNVLYEHRRSRIAKKMKWRAEVLDKERGAVMPKEKDDTMQGMEVTIPDIESWKEPVVLSEVLTEAEKVFNTYIHFRREDDSLTATLWCAQTHAVDFLVKYPYLGARSPEPDCGKTTLLGIIYNLVKRPFMASSATSASIFRLMHLYHPTLIIDELDTMLQKDPEFFGILNSGHSKKGGVLVRVLGDEQTVQAFITYGPKAYGIIGQAPAAFASRSLPIILERKMAEDNILDYPDEDDAELVKQLQVLASKMARWTQDNEQAIRACKPDTSGLTNRKRDNWRPLLVYATLAGGDWLKRARQAAGAEDPFTQVLDNKQFLIDVRNIFLTRDATFMTTTELITDLKCQESSGWNECGRNREGITPKMIAKMFGDYGVKVGQGYNPQNQCMVRAYCLGDLAGVFTRYLADEPPELVDVKADRPLSCHAEKAKTVSFD